MLTSRNPPDQLLDPLFAVYHSGHLDETISQVNRLLESFPDSDLLLNLLGVARLEQGKHADAEYALSKSCTLNPGNAMAFNNLGAALHEQRKLEAAAFNFREALRHNPEYAEAYNNLGNVLKDQNDIPGATDCYSNAITLNPEYAAAYFNLAGISRIKGDTEGAIRNYRRAVEIRPDYAAAWNNLANVLREISEPEEALTCYGRALMLNPGFAEAHNNLGVLLQHMGRHEEAIAHFNYALRLKPDYEAVHENKFNIHEKLNQLDEAADVLDQAKLIFGNLPESLLLSEAVLCFREKRFPEITEKIAGLDLDRLTFTNKLKWFEIMGKTLEKQHDYSEAFKIFRDMNSLKLRQYEQIAPFSDKYLEKVTARATEIETDTIRKTSRPPVSQSSSFVFLVGFPRSGTTLLDTFLRGHPDISVLEEKPLLESAISRIDSFLPLRQLEALATGDVGAMRNKYLQVLRDHGGKPGKLNIDKLPLNLNLLPEIHRIFPEAKILLAVRHPLDCLLSNYKQNFEVNSAMYLMSDLHKSAELYDSSMRIMEHSCKRYLLDIHMVRYEDLVQDKEKVLMGLFGFLGVEWDSSVMDHRKTAFARKHIQTPSYSQITEDIYRDSSLLWENYARELEPFSQKLQYWIEKFGYTA